MKYRHISLSLSLSGSVTHTYTYRRKANGRVVYAASLTSENAAREAF